MKAQLVDSQAAEAETASSLKVAQEAYAPDVEVPEAIGMALILAGGGLAGVIGGAVLIFVLGMLKGKTFCAYNLAIATARAGKRTLLAECELQQAIERSSPLKRLG